jgi:hypothetical protein
MERELHLTLLILIASAAFGCGDNSSSTSSGGTAALEALDTMPRYAVVSSDFSSSSIATLDEDFVVIDESWINSGTTYPGLVATLSGDVVLPNRQAADGTFAVIDRFLTDVVTRFFVPSGNLNGQVRTHGDVGESGFSSNPQDFIFASEDSAWAPRYESNLNPSAPPENQGNDLIEVNPSDMSVTGARIDLSSLDVTATAMTPDGAVEVDVFARPSRGVLVGSTIVVGLDRISANFDAAGSGMVALVDLEDESVAGMELPGLQSCGNVLPVPGVPSKVVVACVGFAVPFGDEPQVRASSGIALLDVNESGVTIERVWRVADHPSDAIAVNSVAVVDEQRVVGVAARRRGCDRRFRNDRGRIVPDRSGHWIPRAHPRLHRILCHRPIGVRPGQRDALRPGRGEFAVGEGSFVEVGSTEIAPSLSLPPTKVYLLD